MSWKESPRWGNTTNKGVAQKCVFYLISRGRFFHAAQRVALSKLSMVKVWYRYPLREFNIFQQPVYAALFRSNGRVTIPEEFDFFLVQKSLTLTLWTDFTLITALPERISQWWTPTHNTCPVASHVSCRKSRVRQADLSVLWKLML